MEKTEMILKAIANIRSQYDNASVGTSKNLFKAMIKFIYKALLYKMEIITEKDFRIDFDNAMDSFNGHEDYKMLFMVNNINVANFYNHLSKSDKFFMKDIFELEFKNEIK